MTADNAAIEAAIKERDVSSNGLKKLQLVADDFLKGSVYYAEYKSDETDESDAFYYIYITRDGKVKLYDDGVEVIVGLKDFLDRRRSLWQRVSEFTLVELIGAMIALTVTISFVWLSLRGGLNKEFIGIFGIIVGYYFGKNAK